MPAAPDVPPAVTYLRSLTAVRERSHQVLAAARAGRTRAFALDETRVPAVVDRVVALIRRDYPEGPATVPPHSRWRHFEMDKIDRVQRLLDAWAQDDGGSGAAEAKGDKLEPARRVFDLFLVSVLLDAGAGNAWRFVEHGETGPDGPRTYGRSEGLAVASLAMFKAGAFSSDPEKDPHRVDSVGLKKLTVEALAKGFQVSDANPLVGLEGRCQLLVKLGAVLDAVEAFRSPLGHGHPPRPGHLVDHLARAPEPARFDALWAAVFSLTPIWPSRATLEGHALGDVWPCPCIKGAPAPVPLQTEPEEGPARTLVPFHKLSQWLTYSLCEPLERLLGWKLGDGKLALTGLAEYRNGGLLVDAGVLALKNEARERGMLAAAELAVKGDPVDERVPLFKPDDEVIVEWRALTVALLDEIGAGVRKALGMSEAELELAKVLEGGTWKAGREIAAEKRPKTKSPPLNLISDGTVF